MDALDLRHHFLVDMQPAGGIDNQHIGKSGPGMFQRGFSNVDRLLLRVRREIFKLVLIRQYPQLFQGRRTIDIATCHDYGFSVLVPAPFAQLCDGSGLAGAL